MTNGNKYKEKARHYLENGYKFLHKHRFSKASELFWGATSQAVKAVALERGGDLSSHSSLWNFVGKLENELKDPSIRIRFSVAESLHRNFYEHDMPPEAIRRNAKEAKTLVKQLLSIAKNGTNNNSKHR